jgi:excinuclease UvrABC ATPase subunit
VDPSLLAALVRELAVADTAVVLVDHRPEVVRAADRVVHLGDTGGEVAP